MSPETARAIERIRGLPWRGLEVLAPPRAEPPEARALARGPTAPPRPLGETTVRLLGFLRDTPGWHSTRVLAEATGEQSRRVCSAMDTLIWRGLVERRAATWTLGPGRRSAIYRALALAAVAVVGAGCCGGADAHEWYGGLRSPTGIPCCNDRDCRKLDACTQEGGKQGVAANGGCWPIPYDKVVTGISSPDGEMHGCFPNTLGAPGWLCFILPGSA